MTHFGLLNIVDLSLPHSLGRIILQAVDVVVGVLSPVSLCLKEFAAVCRGIACSALLEEKGRLNKSSVYSNLCY